METAVAVCLWHQVIESLYQTATSVAQQLNLPFMETASLTNGDVTHAQLQAVQVLLEGTSVGIKKNQEQVRNSLEANRVCRHPLVSV